MTTYIYTSTFTCLFLNVVGRFSFFFSFIYNIFFNICRCSTIGAIIMTPLLTKLLAGQLVPVDAAVSFLFPTILLNYKIHFIKPKH